jgi:hypothetical protein
VGAGGEGGDAGRSGSGVGREGHVPGSSRTCAESGLYELWRTGPGVDSIGEGSVSDGR